MDEFQGPQAQVHEKCRVNHVLDTHTTDDGVLLKSNGNTLSHLLLHRLVRIHDRLLVDDDLRRVSFGPADS